MCLHTINFNKRPETQILQIIIVRFIDKVYQRFYHRLRRYFSECNNSFTLNFPTGVRLSFIRINLQLGIAIIVNTVDKGVDDTAYANLPQCFCRLYSRLTYRIVSDDLDQILRRRCNLEFTKGIGGINPHIRIRIIQQVSKRYFCCGIREVKSANAINSNTSNQRVLAPAPIRQAFKHDRLQIRESRQCLFS